MSDAFRNARIVTKKDAHLETIFIQQAQIMMVEIGSQAIENYHARRQLEEEERKKEAGEQSDDILYIEDDNEEEDEVQLRQDDVNTQTTRLDDPHCPKTPWAALRMAAQSSTNLDLTNHEDDKRDGENAQGDEAEDLHDETNQETGEGKNKENKNNNTHDGTTTSDNATQTTRLDDPHPPKPPGQSSG